MKQVNKKTGNKGECVAVEKLLEEGYEILTRNYRNKWGEIDVVAKRDERIVFVEVKTKMGEDYGEPWEMINKHKLKQVENMGYLWCEEMEWKGLCRIDVVGVWLDRVSGEATRIEHWEDVQM